VRKGVERIQRALKERQSFTRSLKKCAVGEKDGSENSKNTKGKTEFY